MNCHKEKKMREGLRKCIACFNYSKWDQLLFNLYFTVYKGHLINVTDV